MRIYRRALAADGFTDIAPFDPVAIPESCDLSKPTVLFLPGVQTTDGAAFTDHTAEEALNTKAEVVLRHLGGGAALAGDRTRFFTLTYSPQPSVWMLGGWTNSMGRVADIALSNRRPHDYFSRDAKRMFEALILPGLQDALAEKDVPALQRRLTNLTLVADSYGGVFAEQLANVLKYECRRAGLDKTQIAGLLKSVHVIAASNVPLRNGNCRMTGVYFEARGDTMIDAARDNHAASALRHLSREIRAVGDRLVPVERSDAACHFAAERAREIDNGWRYARILYASIADKLVFSKLGSEEIAAALAREADDGDPDIPKPYVPFGRCGIAMKPVRNGMVVTFNAPERYPVVLRERGENGQAKLTGLFYDNESRHHSLGYTYPLPGHRDHADLFGRVLCHSVRRGEKGHSIPVEEMLATPCPAYGRARHPEIDRRLDEVWQFHLRDEPELRGSRATGGWTGRIHPLRDDNPVGWEWEQTGAGRGR